MIRRAYEAILLDLDGTLVDDDDRIHPRTLEALRAADRQGVRVMIATGRSELATRPPLEALGLENPAVVYNGAGLYCPVAERMIEERTLSDRTLSRAVRFGLEHGHMTVTMAAGAKYAVEPVLALERLALHDMTGLRFVEADQLMAQRTIRVTLFSDRHRNSAEFARELEQSLDQPIYLTHFPLSALPHHRESKLLVCDVHPPCRGKAEGLRVLEETWGIASERVVAVGDASNDVPMFEAAGLAVAMRESMSEALAAAQRVIGSNDSDTIGELVEELFLG